MKTKTALIVTFMAVAPLLSSCFLGPSACTLELEERLDPTTVVLEVGESITPTFELYSCQGEKQLEDSFTWVSANPQIASVDRMSGAITALSVGKTDVEVSGKEYRVTQAVKVTVVETQ